MDNMVAAVRASVLAEKVDVAPPSALDQLGAVMMNATHNAASAAGSCPSDASSSTDSLPPPPEVCAPRAPSSDDIGPPPPFAAPAPADIDSTLPPLPSFPAPQPPSV